MALTKISTGGVKDDAASRDKIADEAVDEARLQISNAGSDGQFLQKQSGDTGGLTWATVSVPDSDKIFEGNAYVECDSSGGSDHVIIKTAATERVKVNSNGVIHVGGTGSSSVNFGIKGSTVTSNVGKLGINSSYSNMPNAENIALGKVIFGHGTGEDGPVIEGSAGGSWSTNNLPSALKFYTVPASSTTQTERLRISKDGALGVGGANYGTSGHVLTSGGPSAAPSWAAIPPGGNTVDLVADGAIAAGKPCVIKSNGKAEQVQIASTVLDEVSRNAASEQTFGSTSNNYLEGNTQKNSVAYNPDSDTTFVFSHVQNIDRMVGQLFSTPSTGTDAQKATITRHQLTEITSEGAGEDQGHYCVCNLSGKRFFIVYEKYNVLKCRVVTVASNNQSFTVGTENNLISSSSVKYKWFSAVETTTDRVVLMCTSESNSGIFNDEHFGLICGDISNSGNTWTKRSHIELDNNNSGQGSKGGRIDYDSTNGVIGVTWSTDNNVTFRALKVASGTGAAFTAGTGTQYASGTLRNTLKYHSNSGSWITFSCTNGGANYVQAHTVNSSTLAITSGTAVHLSSWAGGIRGVDIEVTNDHKIILGWLRSSQDITTKMYTISGTTLTATSGSAINLADSLSNPDKDSFGMVYQGHNGVVSVFGHRGTNGVFGGSGLNITNATNINTSGNNVLGFAPSAINDGATGTINLPGNTVDNQSGLTAGSRYYCRDDGTISTTFQTSRAGILALSATKGVVFGHDT